MVLRFAWLELGVVAVALERGVKLGRVLGPALGNALGAGDALGAGNALGVGVLTDS
jgi:hypothetical protein